MAVIQNTLVSLMLVPCQGPHFCLEGKQPFFWFDVPGFPYGNCFEEYRHWDALWVFKWRWACIVRWSACFKMGELHEPLQVSDSLPNLGPHQLWERRGERDWETASPPALNLSQHQGLFQWVSSSHQMAKVLELQLQHQSFQWTPRTDLL